MSYKLVRVVLALTVMAAVLTGSSPSGAAETQFTVFDQVVSQQADAYAMPQWSAPPDWTAPVNYAEGRALVRLHVADKPTTKLVKVQVCMWRAKWTIETCSPTTLLNQEGLYWIDLGMVSSWWKKNGNWSWEVPFEALRIMVKDENDKLMMGVKCGTACYTGTDLTQHVPIVFDASMIVVAKGATLSAPAKWAGCPVSWGHGCDGSAAGPPPAGSPNNRPSVSAGPDQTVSGSTAALQGFVTDDGLPLVPGRTTTAWSKASGPGTVSFANKGALATTATFSVPGTYQLTLRAKDGELPKADSVLVTVGSAETPTTTTTAAPTTTTTAAPTTTTTAPSTTTTTAAPTTTTTKAPSGAPSLTVRNGAVAEGHAGSKSLPIKLTLSAPSPTPVTVTLSTADGSARERSDYWPRTDVAVTFEPGQTAAWFGVAVIGDRTVETNETVKVVVTSVQGATIADGIGIGTIRNDD